MTDTDRHKLWHPSTTGYTLCLCQLSGSIRLMC